MLYIPVLISFHYIVFYYGSMTTLIQVWEIGPLWSLNELTMKQFLVKKTC